MQIARRSFATLLALALVSTFSVSVSQGDDAVIKIGLVGLDSSHATAFTKSLNAEPSKPGLGGVRVVAAFPGGSPDLPTSADRVEGYTKTIADSGVKIVGSIEELLPLVDAVIINSVDGRVHLKQAKAVIAGKKPLFIDKPLAVSVAEGQEIFADAAKAGVPCFTSSSLRYCTELAAWTKQGGVVGCDAYSPCARQESHPDLFWYGIHGVETLFAVMGPGCESVSCIRTEGTDVVTGIWKDGRIGTFRGIRTGKSGFGATVFTAKAIYGGPVKVDYDLLLVQIVEFFKTGKPPVSSLESLEILGFMEAANESHRQGGKPVKMFSSTAAK